MTNGGIASLNQFKKAEYLKSKIRIPKSKICFLKFLFRLGRPSFTGGWPDT